MTKNLVLGLTLVAGLGLNSLGHAQTKPPVKTKKAAPARQALVDKYSGAGYGNAGCGLGSIVFGPKAGMVQILAATTNDFSLSQSFGITSGTSNCDIPEMGQQAAVFIEVNKEIVQKDAARGEGETMNALADLLDCGTAEDLGKAIRANFTTYFGAKINSYETVRRLYNNGVCSKEKGV